MPNTLRITRIECSPECTRTFKLTIVFTGTNEEGQAITFKKELNISCPQGWIAPNDPCHPDYIAWLFNVDQYLELLQIKWRRVRELPFLVPYLDACVGVNDDKHDTRVRAGVHPFRGKFKCSKSCEIIIQGEVF